MKDISNDAYTSVAQAVKDTGLQNQSERFRGSNPRGCAINQLCMKIPFETDLGHKLTATVVIDSGSGWFVGTADEVPGTVAQGESVDAMLDELKECVDFMLGFQVSEQIENIF